GANHVVRSRTNTGEGNHNVVDHLLDLPAQVVGADKLSPFVEWTLTGEKHHPGDISNGHMVIARRLMKTGGIETLDQGVILSECLLWNACRPFLTIGKAVAENPVHFTGIFRRKAMKCPRPCFPPERPRRNDL